MLRPHRGSDNRARRADRPHLHPETSDHRQRCSRAERRLSLARLREALVERGFCAVDMLPTKVPRVEKNQRAATRRGVSAGHVGDTASGTSWTPLEITHLHAAHSRQMPRVGYVVDTPERARYNGGTVRAAASKLVTPRDRHRPLLRERIAVAKIWDGLPGASRWDPHALVVARRSGCTSSRQ